MSGMVLDDSRVVFAMDSRKGGDIFPAKVNEDGTCTGKLISLKQMDLLMKRVEKILADMAVSLHEGRIAVNPAKGATSSSNYYDVCKFCDYKDVCGVDEDTPRREITKSDHEKSRTELGGENDA